MNPTKRNIVLTGFMGTGKTTVGRMLAAQLGYEFVDTDELLQERTGRTIPEIFQDLGEAAFRQMEAELAQELSNGEGLVISTGGRMMLDPANVAALSSSGRVFCLVATPEEILSRLMNDKDHPRPLLKVPNPGERIVELLQERREGYARFPQVTTNERQPAEVSSDLISVIQEDPKRFVVEHTVRSYEYIVGGGILSFIRQLADVAGQLVIITDTRVGELYSPSCGPVDHVVTIPVGAQHKTMTTVADIYDQLLDVRFDRSGTIVALGGSTVGDVAGFVAGTYMRGVDFIQCPTSLMALADTSVGGKSGLDLPQGKNLIGIIKEPRAVIADVATLQTLPQAEFVSGMAEVIKHGLLAAAGLLEKVENGTWADTPERLHLSLPNLQALVAQSIQVKIAVVQADPYEQSQRMLLNLGHTFAYAMEQVSQHSIRHGEAVAIGLVAAANLSHRLGYCSGGVQERIEAVLTKVGLPNRIPEGLTPQALLDAMARDKKRLSGQLRFVLLHDIGDAFVTDAVSGGDVLETLNALSLH